ncbi:snare-domain-containing protein [Tilletiaria anomala UBC 951]|uniref:Snare-domain-containing protein n=1 Tax=Tilletiaria anomala (strain ATCC 24038 / CBS 436.72 / UBC 951) TaxID=1037660 RepID=A0A066WRC6_TILAU|nr:snare-domain-containing protein [Tilletiaria anomala UBC 951]KDN53210.1 snare-domain-containing protein [Tilletiaria anomala UBC 951]
MSQVSSPRVAVLHAATLSLVQERSRSISLGLPASTSTNKLIEKNIKTLTSSATELTADLEEKNRLAKAGRIGLEEVREAEDAVTELKTNLENLLHLLGTDEWATEVRSRTNESCLLLAPSQPTSSVPEHSLAEASTSRSTYPVQYHDDVEEDTDVNIRLLRSQKDQMQDQDAQLDKLGASIARQHHLSLQMNEELESQGELLNELDDGVGQTTLRLGRASNQTDRFRRAARDHASSCTIIGLIMILVTLIAIFK